MCYLAERGRCAVNGASINRELIKLGSAAALPPWDGGVVDPLKHVPFYICRHVKFGRSASKDVRINRRELAKLVALRGPAHLRWSVADPQKSAPTCYPAEFGRFRSNGTSVIKEIRLKNWPLAFHLIRSLMGTDSDRSATYDFLLTFHRNLWPISNGFLDKRRFQSKIAIFSLLPCISATADEVPHIIG